MKVSHEVPLVLLKESLKWNDYQYALVHLLEENKEYRDHFLWCKHNGIEIYLDNSAHELGYPIQDSILIKWIKLLEPSNVFIPDFIEEKNRTAVEAKKWSKIEIPENTTKVAIIQSKNINETLELVQNYVDLGYSKIAFPYASSYYRDLIYVKDKDLGLALGRIKVLNKVIESGILNSNHKIHLLGTACPIDFHLLKHEKCIESIDTSNPIMMALENKTIPNVPIYNKPKININQSFYSELKDIDLNLIEENVFNFKKILK